ncbi:MAG: NUDIX hydrolase [Candidatus Gastranaerophilales bacterium]|nr:NUDIX hydrolase [Candidatus Gastranaerophilales bacterium]
MEQYRNPAVTVDMALFTREENPRILLIKRKNPPFQDHWALPGGFMDYDEEIEDAAYRELEEETGITGVRLEQIHAFGKVGRDPRGRTVSIVYRAVVDPATVNVQAGDDAKEAEWFDIRELPPLAFDHAEIIDYAVKTLPRKE